MAVQAAVPSGESCRIYRVASPGGINPGSDTNGWCHAGWLEADEPRELQGGQDPRSGESQQSDGLSRFSSPLWFTWPTNGTVQPMTCLLSDRRGSVSKVKCFNPGQSDRVRGRFAGRRGETQHHLDFSILSTWAGKSPQSPSDWANWLSVHPSWDHLQPSCGLKTGGRKSRESKGAKWKAVIRGLNGLFCGDLGLFCPSSCEASPLGPEMKNKNGTISTNSYLLLF